MQHTAGQHVLLGLTAAIAIAMKPTPMTAQQETNYDESKVPKLVLPHPLIAGDGSTVESSQQWKTKRRTEILNLFRDHVYGRTPNWKPQRNAARVNSDIVFNDTATRLQIRLPVTDGITLHLLAYLPKSDDPVPMFVGFNFHGNHTTTHDPDVPIGTGWVQNKSELGITEHHSNSKARGMKSSRWPFELVTRRGFGLATVCYSDLDPDFDDGFQNGVHAIDGGTRNEYSWGSIAAWAWGLSRIMDYFESDDRFDAKRVAVFGHSRLGKTALWAGAEDERFSIVISNNSGCGGAALSRREFGETVKRINTSFPHWFCSKFKSYNDDVNALPIDQHMLIALMAPRPVYISSASEDLWADPRGEFLAAVHATPVYKLLGKVGLPKNKFPTVNTPLTGTIGYHCRDGQHDITNYDWNRFLDFAESHWR